MPEASRFSIPTLGDATFLSPLELSKVRGDNIYNFVHDEDRWVYDLSLQEFQRCLKEGEEPLCLEKAGPREHLYFDPSTTKAAIVTCGGLCPGINNVIRGIVMALHYFYGVREIVGVRYGYEGLNPAFGHELLPLEPNTVKDIHQFGGTFLGSSRGAQPVDVMVDTLEREGINVLFGIGGDGTLKGLNAVAEEIKRRKLPISIAGIPKTIDNDIDLIDKSFGFETSFDIANPILRDAHNEASGAYNGVAIIKLMGRDSGFIAASAALAQPVVNFVLIPELDFSLQGKDGFLDHLEKRLQHKKHAVVVVAEGAGQHLFEAAESTTDASGNVQHKDIGVYLKEVIGEHFKKAQIPVTVKYIDPSYIIRSAAANSGDSVFCSSLAYHAVHGALSGKSQFVVGKVNNRFCYLPISEVVQKRRKIDLEGEFWFSVLQSTGQPFTMG